MPSRRTNVITRLPSLIWPGRLRSRPCLRRAGALCPARRFRRLRGALRRGGYALSSLICLDRINNCLNALNRQDGLADTQVFEAFAARIRVVQRIISDIGVYVTAYPSAVSTFGPFLRDAPTACRDT